MMWGAVAVTVIGLLAWGLQPSPQWADIQPVTRGALQLLVAEEGQTRLHDRFTVYAPVDGYLLRHDHEVGDPVAVGEVLARLEPMRSSVLDPRARAEARENVAAAEAELQAAEEQVRAAQAEADRAASDYQRKQKLLETHSISEDVVEQAAAGARVAQANRRSAAARVDTVRYQLNAARAVLEYSAATESGSDNTVALLSPVDGRIMAVLRESEGPIRLGEPVLEVGNPAAIEVITDVLSADAVRIRPGSRVLFEQWGGQQPLEGAVRRVEPVGFTKVSALGVEEQRVWVIADIVSPAEMWRDLGAGYRVESRFVLDERRDVLRIPQSALFRNGSDWQVYAVDDGGRARLRAVQVGLRNGLEAEITAGLEAGESVIASPDAAIADGSRVRSRL